jgi:hypothetical protein
MIRIVAGQLIEFLDARTNLRELAFDKTFFCIGQSEDIGGGESEVFRFRYFSRRPEARGSFEIAEPLHEIIAIGKDRARLGKGCEAKFRSIAKSNISMRGGGAKQKRDRGEEISHWTI